MNPRIETLKSTIYFEKRLARTICEHLSWRIPGVGFCKPLVWNGWRLSTAIFNTTRLRRSGSI